MTFLDNYEGDAWLTLSRNVSKVGLNLDGIIRPCQAWTVPTLA
jgi:hypothetical protein